MNKEDVAPVAETIYQFSIDFLSTAAPLGADQIDRLRVVSFEIANFILRLADGNAHFQIMKEAKKALKIGRFDRI